MIFTIMMSKHLTSEKYLQMILIINVTKNAEDTRKQSR